MAVPAAVGENVDKILRQFQEAHSSEQNYEEEEIKEEKRKLEKRKQLLSQLPEHCLGFAPPEPNEPSPPAPVRTIEPEECFKICPKIISRAEWQARPAKSQPEQMMFRVRPAVFKETDCPNCDEEDHCKLSLRTLQQYQMDYLEFDDIAYSFMIGEDGNIYEGRGWCSENAKARGFSGIAYIGYHSLTPGQGPSDAMLLATYKLIMCGIIKGFIASPFSTNAFSGTTPLELMKELITIEEDVDYRTRPEDLGTYGDDTTDEEED